MTSKQLRVALEELEWELAFTAYPSRNLMKAITAIKEALAQPEREQSGQKPNSRRRTHELPTPLDTDPITKS